MVCIHANVDSLLNKRAELQAQITLHNPDIIGISEVKPKNMRYAVQECEVSLDGFELFHNLEDTGRGICLYVREHLKPSLNTTFDNGSEEAILVECQLDGSGLPLLLGLIYRSPNSPPGNDAKINSWIINIANTKTPHLLLMGDLNHPEIDWQNERCDRHDQHPASKFLKATKDAYLTQHQRENTRHRLLDLVLTKNDDTINEITATAGLGKSDHSMLPPGRTPHNKALLRQSRLQ